ncbi:MAG: glycosyltransferase [Desulfarculales bacterium]|jgi:glycosyltransferase involved in cell wall biosynthesis|nr:glycosyltransferase [Desulfarculales bacterium]
MPYISIITATSNAAALLPRLLQSLASQSFRDFELIIQDGASKDNTIALAESYCPRLPHLVLNSEPDRGIYDAWNRALPHVNGQWVLFLGADDKLAEDQSLSSAISILKTLPAAVQYLAASLIYMTPDGRLLERVYPDIAPLQSLASKMSLPHPALFHHRDLFARHSFDSDLRIAGDYDFLARTLTGSNCRIANIALTHMGIGGISGTPASLLKSELELWRCSLKYFPQGKRGMLYLRLSRSLIFYLLFKLNPSWSYQFADLARRFNGKAPLWSLPPQPVAPPAVSASPLITLIVATYNRQAPLRKLLTSLNKQRYKNFEIIVADQNPEGFLSPLLASFKNLKIRQIHCRIPGVSAARNAALPLAQGQIIAFPDDDCFYAPDTLALVTDYFNKNLACAGLVAGWRLPEKSTTKFNISFRKSLTVFSAFHNAGATFQFYRREVTDKVGFFDESLGPDRSHPYACSEDTDYLLRTLKADYKIDRVRSVPVYHENSNLRTVNMEAKAYNYGKYRMLLLNRHGLPLWFKLAHILYPLILLVPDWLRHGKMGIRYCWVMFKGRFMEMDIYNLSLEQK